MESWSNLLILFVLLTLTMHIQSAPTSRRSRAAAVSEEEPTTTIESNQEEEPQDKSKEEGSTSSPVKRSNRRNKALNLFGYYPSFLSSGLDYSDDDDDDIAFGVNDDHIDEDDLSRTIPSRRQQQNKKKNGNGNTFQNDQINSLQYDNSPIFFIRLPPTPYMFVPGLGYVSQPPSLGPPMSPQIPQGIPQVSDQFINLPLDFVSNGKPIGVYQWNGAPGYSQGPQAPQVPQMSPFGYGPSQPLMPTVQQPNYNMPSYTRPKPKPAPSNSKVTNLKGQYLFNGKPADSVYVLRDTYNSIYSDALQNFYP